MLRAAGFAVLSIFAFQASQALAQLVALPAGEKVFARGVGGLLFAWLAWCEIRRLGGLPDARWHIARGVLGSVSIYAMMLAIGALPLALFTVLLHARVLLIIPLARLIHQERASPALWAAALAGLAGVGIAVAPSLPDEAQAIGIAAVAVAVLASAVSQVTVARLTDTSSPHLIVTIFGLFSMVVVAVPAALAHGADIILPTVKLWIWPTENQMPPLIGLACTGVLAQLFAAYAYREAGVAKIAPFGYLEIILAVVLDYWIHGAVVTVSQMTGGVLILGATSYITWSRDRLMQSRALHGRRVA